ncbi:MAG: 50S ribosomal protein L15 [Alphaproteobacteria bacterium]
MKLNQLRDRAGARKRKFKVGRGSSSGVGKTAGRGMKGAKARAGVTIAGFEGGQTALHRRVPKRGFFNRFGNDFAEVNLGRIQAAVDAGKLNPAETITYQALLAAGVARNARDGVRLLGQGELRATLNFEVAGASRPAIEAVKKAGGNVMIMFRKPVRMNRKGEPGKRQQRRAKAAEKRAQANA